MKYECPAVKIPENLLYRVRLKENTMRVCETNDFWAFLLVESLRIPIGIYHLKHTFGISMLIIRILLYGSLVSATVGIKQKSILSMMIHTNYLTLQQT